MAETPAQMAEQFISRMDRRIEITPEHHIRGGAWDGPPDETPLSIAIEEALSSEGYQFWAEVGSDAVDVTGYDVRSGGSFQMRYGISHDLAEMLEKMKTNERRPPWYASYPAFAVVLDYEARTIRLAPE